MIFDKILDMHQITPHNCEFELEQFLMHSTLEGAACVKVITGKGKGIIRAKVIEVLKRSKYVSKYKTPLWDDGNEGAIAVWLCDC